jgi:pilus assembly protein CpaF
LTAPLLDQVRRQLVGRAGADDGAVADAAAAAARAAGLIVDDTVLARWEQSLTADLVGAGPLEALLELPGITDVLVNAPDQVFVDCGEGLQKAPVAFESADAVRALAIRLAAAAGRRLDDAQPFVDAHLPDGTRLHAILPPLCPSPAISLRVLARRQLELADLVRLGAMSSELAGLLVAIVQARLAFVISGGTGSGKTTVLGALLAVVPTDQRIVTIEDAAEIVTSHPHVVRLLTRVPNVEGRGAVDLRELVRQALRMRPDRIVVGEFRGAEVVELLAALNTGHSGGAATVHANGLADVPARFEALAALGGLGRAAVIAQAAAAFDVVLHLARAPSGQRHLAAVGVVERSANQLRVAAAWTLAGGRGPAAGRLEERLADDAPVDGSEDCR